MVSRTIQAAAILVFTAQLNKSKCATALANARSAYAEKVSEKLAEGSGSITISSSELVTGVDGATVTVDNTSKTFTVTYNGVTESFTVDSDVTLQ